ncbi:MAG TPA: DUF4276 family protein [Fimbriimonadaceae bacterium]|jgi:hypothetical protein|nr:DUF4276 family protein [Fimbriimonadaceae bacterium]
MSDIAWVEFFVEELSMEAALRELVPKIRPGLDFQIHAFAGVQDMLSKLPARFRGYAGWIPDDWRIVVVRDEDRQDCRKLKAEIEQIAVRAGLVPKAKANKSGQFHVLTRIAVEELEAWLLGDVPALAETYPGVPASLASRRPFRDVDGIKGGTWEALERVLQEAGHFLGGLPKIQVARQVASRMNPERNTSRSFQTFRSGLRGL